MRRCKDCFETGYVKGLPVDTCARCGGVVEDGDFAVNHGQGLYLVPCGTGFSCLGFDYAESQRLAVVGWLAAEGDSWAKTSTGVAFEPGTPDAFQAYDTAMRKGAEFHSRTGKCCNADLTPELIGKEGLRVEVTGPDNYKSRFWVGKSTGWCPIHLEIRTRRSAGGGSVYIPKGGKVRVVEASGTKGQHFGRRG